MRPTREVLVLVHRGPEALALRRAGEDPYWHVIAGGVEEGETYAQAAARELLEETGLDAQARVHSLRRRYTYPLSEELPERRALYPAGVDEILVECFAAEAPPGWEPRLNEEHSEYRWCSFADAGALMRWSDVREVLGLLERRVVRKPRRRFVLKRPTTPAVFFLRFSSEAAAEEAGDVLREDGFEVTVETEPAHWLVQARGLVRKDSFDVADQAMTALAAAKGGRYAGHRREPSR